MHIDTNPLRNQKAMPCKILGRTNLEVPIVGLGTAFIGIRDGDSAHRLYTKGEVHLMEEDFGIATVIEALAAGCKLIDTAPLYGARRSETIIGKALAAHPELAVDCIVTTKVGQEFGGKFDFSADAVKRSLALSQKLLGIERFPVVYIHDPMGVPFDNIMGPHGALMGLRDCQKAGIVSFVGVAANEPAINELYIETGEFDAAVVPEALSLINPLAFRRILPLAKQHNVGLIGATPLERGVLATGVIKGRNYLDRRFNEDTIRKVAVIRQLCETFGVPMNAVALQWCTGQAQVAATIPGACTPDEARSNILAAKVPIPDHLWTELNSVIM